MAKQKQESLRAGPISLRNPRPRSLTGITSNGAGTNGAAPGGLIEATTDLLGRRSVPVEGMVAADGSFEGEVHFGDRKITIDQLFADNSFPDTSLFPLTDIRIRVDQADHDGQSFSRTVSFTAALQMNTPLLDIFQDFLGAEETIMMSGTIITDSEDLSQKIQPERLELSSVAIFQKTLFTGTTLRDLQFTLTVDKTDGQWSMTPAIEGKLDVVHIGEGISARITEKEGALEMAAAARNVRGAFGLDALLLDAVAVSGAVGRNTQQLSVDATFVISTTTLSFSGMINEEAVGLLVPQVPECSMNEVAGIFNEISGGQLALPDFDVAFEHTSVSLASNDCEINGVAVQAGMNLSSAITVHGYTARTTAQFSTQGVRFSGSFGEIELGPVKVHESSLDFQIYRRSANLPTAFRIAGRSTIEGIDVDCGISFEKSASGFNPVLYGYLDAASLSLSSIWPQLRNSFADSLSFSKAGFIYSGADTVTQDPELSFTVKKGLNLMGILEEIPVLSDLTGKRQIGLVLSAQIGPRPGITIEVPDTRLELGNSVKTDPFKMSIVTAPAPALQLGFGMDITVPNQVTPLNFDAILSLGPIDAKGGVSMQNYWNDPFGLRGLKIGPTLGLQLGINYAQFAATGTPSEFGLAGGLVLGNKVVDMAMNISSNPMNQLLYGKIQQLDIRDLVELAERMTPLEVSEEDIPNFLDLRDVQIYIAPNGGQIGAIIYEPGFSYLCDVIILGKAVNMYSRIADNGIVGQGHIDKIELGPLKIQGTNGGDASLDMEISTQKQALMIDGEMNFLGTGQGIFADISTKGITFRFTRRFIDALVFEITGQSVGSLEDPASLDFNLSGAMNNGITAYLKNQVAGKIHEVINASETKIEEAQAKVDRAKAAYEAKYQPALKALQKAQKDADAYLKQCRTDLANAKAKAGSDISKAERELSRAKATYDQAFADARQKVEKAERDYNQGITDAQNKLSIAERDYNNGVRQAQAQVDAARRDFDNSVGDAQRKVTDAGNKVNGLRNDINATKREIDRLSWWDPRRIPLGTKLAALETAYHTAKLALSAANGFLNAVKTGAKYTAFEAAKAALHAAQYGAKYTAFNAAKQALNAAKYGARYTAFQGAKATLEAVRTGTEYTAWKAAEGSLAAARVAGQRLIDAASATLSKVGSSAAYLALAAARKSLEAVRTGTAAMAFESAKAALETAKLGAGGVLKLAEYISSHAGDLIDVRSMKISGGFKKMTRGGLFKAEISIAVLNKVHNWVMDFNAQDVLGFVEALFKKALAEAKQIAGI